MSETSVGYSGEITKNITNSAYRLCGKCKKMQKENTDMRFAVFL